MSAADEAPDRPASDELDRIFSLPPGRSRDISIHLQTAILEHRLKPGAKLSEDEVGEVFGVSRTVVRTALQALAHSGLVTIERNRGAFVSKPTIQEANEVFEARAMIEPSIARMAAERADETDIGRLRAHIAAEHDALVANDTGKALSLSGHFHIAISDIAGRQVLGAFLRSLISRSSLIIALYWKRFETTCESHSHLALVDALAAHDVVKTHDIMKSHIVDLHSGLDLKAVNASEQSLAEILASSMKN
jgi:DNA-binding GntR family transcriptional regulator